MTTPHLWTVSRRPPRSRSRVRQAFTYIAGNTIAFLCGLTVAYVALLHSGNVMTSTIKTGDFLAYYSGAHLVALGHGVHLYDLRTLATLQTALLRPLVAPRGILLPYLYLPYLAIVMAPLGAMPYAAAYAIWLALNIAVLSATLFALEQYTGLVGRPAMVARLAAVTSLPVLMCLFNGQTSILILGLVTLCFLAARRKQSVLAGAVLACASIKLPYVLPFLLVFALRRDGRTIAAFAATLMSLLTMSTLVLGPHIVVHYGQILLQATGWHSQYGYQPARNDSLGGFTALLLPPPASTVVQVLLSLAVLGLLAGCAISAPKVDVPLGLAAVAAVLISPHVLIHDLSLLLLPAAVVLRCRGAGMRVLACLLPGYLAILAGYWLAFAVPVQLPVLAAAALAVLLYRESASRTARGLRIIDLVAARGRPLTEVR